MWSSKDSQKVSDFQQGVPLWSEKTAGWSLIVTVFPRSYRKWWLSHRQSAGPKSQSYPTKGLILESQNLSPDPKWALQLTKCTCTMFLLLETLEKWPIFHLWWLSKLKVMSARNDMGPLVTVSHPSSSGFWKRRFICKWNQNHPCHSQVDES